MMQNVQWVGIVNATPDSFSDGGTYDPVAQALALVEQGAHVIDVGAESTRPNATPVEPAEEWGRLDPVLKALQDVDVLVSVDTRHAATAEKALALGVDWINDVSGLQSAEMLALAKGSQSKWVVMHSLTVPVDPSVIIEEEDVCAYMVAWAKSTIERLEAEGIHREQIILDPGIGFGMTAKQSLEMIAGMERLVAVHSEWLVGHSRKSFMKLLGEEDATQRDPLTRTFSLQLAERGVKYLRVHDVAGHVALQEALA